MITPLQYDEFNRDTWGDYDAAVLAQLASLCYDPCYKPRLYKAPDSTSEVIASNGYSSYGLAITPGALIYGFHQNQPSTLTYLLQITDISLEHQFFSEPIPAGLLANFQKTGSDPYMLCAPHPVVGTGVFRVQIWNNSRNQERIQIVAAVLEPVK
jgi:hypothetical protein